VSPRLNVISLAQWWWIPSSSRENTFRTGSCPPSGASAWYSRLKVLFREDSSRRLRQPRSCA
jgi:hypothetical protein